MPSSRIADGDVLWTPPADARETTRIGRFMDWVALERGRACATYEELWEWSVTDLDGFWGALWDHFGVHTDVPVGEVLAHEAMPGSVWFPGVRINYTGELWRAAEGRDDDVAIVGISQTRPRVDLTFAALRDLVARIRAGLQRLGVGPGDRVVAYLPNLPETAAALFATASLGAVWASAPPEFGPQAVIDRFGQLAPTVLLTVDGYRYGDRDVDVRDRVTAIRAALPSLRHVVALPYNGRAVADAIEWDAFSAPIDGRAEPFAPLPVAFDHPLFVLFSSGTTGLPKAIVHGHGGIVLEAYKNHALSWDLGPGERLMWFSTTAWMMWNALVSSLLTGASIVCIDGSPLHPDLRAQWRIAEQTRPTMLGLGPSFVMQCAKQGIDPAREFDLRTIRSVAAAGSPLPAEGCVWVHEAFGGRVPLSLGSGGTDLCTGIVQGYPIVPVYAGEMSAKCLGVSAFAFDASGRPVLDELGELVITRPMPSMPRFWGDDDGARLRAAYYDDFPGVMRFGDWVRFSPRGTSVITGRSDATLNRGGVRLGTAELYRVVEQHPRVVDSLAVHLEDAAGGAGELLLFVVLEHAAAGDGPGGAEPGDIDTLRAELRGALRDALSPRHVPDAVVEVHAVPRNLIGKKLELPVKRVLQGADVRSVAAPDAMADPTAMDDFVAFAAARRAVGGDVTT